MIIGDNLNNQLSMVAPGKRMSVFEFYASNLSFIFFSFKASILSNGN
jgi:hypothetical protein